MSGEIGGRPQRWQPDTLLEKWNDFVEVQKEKGEPLTMVAFTGWLEYADSTTVTQKLAEQRFSQTKKKIDNDIEADWVAGATTGKYNPTFAIFYAKNKLGYRDKQEREHSGEVGIKTMKDYYKEVITDDD